MYPLMPETIVATTRLRLISAVKYFSEWYSSNNPLAKTAGMLSRKENLAATSLFNPKNKPPVIVVPERDEPGINANV